MRKLIRAALGAFYALREHTELTTVCEDGAVFHPVFRDAAPEAAIRFDGLPPDQDFNFNGLKFHTLPRPRGRLLTRFAAVNDLHFGETVCGQVAGINLGKPVTSEPGERPYPEVMNEAAVEEIAKINPAAVVAKGDLTDNGKPEHYELFKQFYSVFGDRLHDMPGNHDVTAGATMPLPAMPRSIKLPGVILALLDTTVPGKAGGQISREQFQFLENLALTADRPVMIFGHHPPAKTGLIRRFGPQFGMSRRDSNRLKELISANPVFVAYIAGHTHGNNVRRFRQTGDVPFIEVGSVKEWPGNWAEYRVYEGGIVQIVHRTSSPAALAWSDKTRKLMFSRLLGVHATYAQGDIDERCLVIAHR